MNTKKWSSLVRVVPLLLIFLLSCGSGEDTPNDDEHEIITSPFSKIDCLFYMVEINYYDSAGNDILRNIIHSDDIYNWISYLKKAYIDFDDIISETYEVGSEPDDVRETLMALEMWDIGQDYSSFIITESLIISLDD